MIPLILGIILLIKSYFYKSKHYDELHELELQVEHHQLSRWNKTTMKHQFKFDVMHSFGLILCAIAIFTTYMVFNEVESLKEYSTTIANQTSVSKYEIMEMKSHNEKIQSLKSNPFILIFDALSPFHGYNQYIIDIDSYDIDT